MSLVTAKEAADYLGVQTSTIYSYVSRGLLRSTEAPGDESGKRYYLEDLENLKKKADARKGHGPAAASAVRFGPPIIETSVTEIAYRGPIYRGVSAQDMIDNNWSFPEVAEHLWKTEQLDWPAPETESKLTLNRIFERLHEKIQNEEPVVREPREVKASAAAELTALVGDKQAANPEFSERLLHSLGLEKPNPEQVEVIRQTLIFLADHAMNTSTLAVRAAASTGASLHSALIAGLSAFNGPKHGLAPNLIVEWSHSSGKESLDSDSKRAELTQWFAHPSYPDGMDPRADHLLEYLDANEMLPASIQSLLADADKLELGHPSTDVPLAAIELAFDLERNASSAIFAISRMVGWVAHYLEQLEQNFLIRPSSQFRAE
jgi:citrate synthase